MGWLFLSLETIAKESQSDVAATKTYQLKMKETVAVIKRFDAGSSAAVLHSNQQQTMGKEKKNR